MNPSAKYEWRFLSQHRWDFAMMFWLPIILLFLIWWIFSKGTVAGIPIALPSTSGMNASLMLNQMGAPLTMVTTYLAALVLILLVCLLLLLWFATDHE